MSEYLIINLCIIIIPLIFSFEKNLRFYKNILPILISILIVSSVFIWWDSVATQRGDWSFNKSYVGSLKLFGLPFEEILFFITVPYSCIFIYETLKFYLKEKQFHFRSYYLLFISLILIVFAFIFYKQNYTLTVLIINSIFLIIATILYKKIVKSKIFWLTILTTYIPFLIVNYILTSLPIVSYKSSEIWEIRFLTIPLEDFFYSFSLISFYLLTYIISKQRILKFKES